MVHSAAQPPSPPEGAHLVLYDGICGLCNRLLRFLLRHDRRLVFRFARLQSSVGQPIVERSGGNPDEPASLFVVADYRTAASRVLARSDAVLFIAGELGWPWKAARWMRVVPTGIRDRAYDVVARSRYRLFGRYDRCPAPTPEFRGRFID
jgi:predicted DCC family thiol-disulfide oxidoreductase YuxK